MDSDRILNLVLSIPAFVAALTIHEFAHAWMAVRLGDDTPRRLGRLTLDPLAHLDPFGSIMFLLSSLSGFGIGWAKPVPFNPRNLSHPRRDAIWIAVAGPISNLLQVPIWLGLLWLFSMVAQRTGLLLDPHPMSFAALGIRVLAGGVVLNVLLAAFNMLPIPPLDGHYVLEGLGPPFIGELFNAIRPYSFIVLIMLLQLPGDPLGQAIAPFLDLAFSAVAFVLRGHF